MENKKKELNQLKARLEALEPIISKTFKTSKELHSYMEKNRSSYEEGKEIFEKIQALELELMTPEERADEEAHLKRMILKRQGKL